MVDLAQPAHWTTTVIDIAPTSRYGSPTDTARMETTVRLVSALTSVDDDFTTTALPGDGKVLRLEETLLIEATDGVFTLDVMVPPDTIAVSTGGRIDAIVLLPDASVQTTTVQSYEPTDCQVFGTGELPLIGGRPAVAFHAQADPRLLVRYIYG